MSNIDWERTLENIEFQLRTYKKNFSLAFNLEARTVQWRLSPSEKSELSIEQLVLLADYFDCDIMDLLIFDDDQYEGPSEEEKKEKKAIEEKNENEVMDVIELHRQKKKDSAICDIDELLLYLPLVPKEQWTDMIWRCCWMACTEKDFIKSQMSIIYRNIPDSQEKRAADYIRDNILRVKGHTRPDVPDEIYADYYRALEQYIIREYGSNVYMMGLNMYKEERDGEENDI